MKRFISKFIYLLLIFSLWAGEDSAVKALEEEKTLNRPKVGLILAGGGAKGVAHLPVIKAIEELGIPIDFVAGTSIGAIVGGLYACGYNPDEIFDLVNEIDWTNFFVDKPRTPVESILSEHSVDSNLVKIGFDKSFSLSMDSGFASGERIYQFFKEKTLKYPSNIHFDDLEIPFRAVATNLLTGESELIESGDIAEAIRASMSIPGIFTPAKIGDKYYIDGGVTDNFPVEAAVDFGCDIIIAVEISDDLVTEISAFDSNYLVAVAQMFYMTQAPRNRPKYPLADFVFIPDLEDNNLLSFKNVQEIWDLSEKSLEPYMSELEKIRDRVYASGCETKSEITKYDDKSWLTVSDFVLENGSEKDYKFINGLFQKIKGKPFTDEVYKAFISEIYETGNYESVKTRLETFDASKVLTISLTHVPTAFADVLLSGSYTGVLSAKETTKLLLSTDFQYRGLTGINSVFSMKVSFVNGFSANGLYIQPINQKSFAKLNVNYLSDRDFVTSNIQDLTPEGTSLERFASSIGFGYRGSLNRLLYLDLGYSFYKPAGFNTENILASQEKYADSEEDSGISFTVKYSINTLELPDFPKEGFLLTLKNHFLVPFGSTSVPKFCDFIEASFTTAVPLSKKFSLITDVSAGTEYFQQIQTMPKLYPCYGFNLGSRLFSPQFADDYEFAPHKLQTMVSLQFDPWDDITIVGGKIFFSYFVGAENLWESYADVVTNFFDGIQWNTGLQIGVNIKKAFNFFVRGGVSSYGESVVPFLSFDIGTLRL